MFLNVYFVECSTVSGVLIKSMHVVKKPQSATPVCDQPTKPEPLSQLEIQL